MGYGAVARLVAGYLEAFGSRIIAFDPYVSGEKRVEGVPPSNRGQDARDTAAFDSRPSGDPAPAKLVGLEYLLRNSDVVSLHARLTDESYHLIGARELAMMKPTAVLVNTARSGLVDEPALIKALEDKTIIGASLDVFDEEPLPADHPFIRIENVTITAHLAGSTIDSFKNSPRMMAGHLRNCLTGGENLPVVNGVEPSLTG